MLPYYELQSIVNELFSVKLGLLEDIAALWMSVMEDVFGWVLDAAQANKSFAVVACAPVM